MSTSAASIYTDCLLPLKEGYPLYLPELPERLYSAHCREGVSIGDVGIITADGDFDSLFNICNDAPRGHSVEGVGMVGAQVAPPEFALIDPGEIKVRPNYIHPAHPYRAHGWEEQTSVDFDVSSPIL
jgi:hypothetical protein